MQGARGPADMASRAQARDLRPSATGGVRWLLRKIVCRNSARPDRTALLGLALSLLLLLAGSLPAPVRAQSSPAPGPCTAGTLPHGAGSLICVPAAGWNGDLVIWAHGYVAAHQPLGFHHLVLGDGTPVPLLAQALGFAFATTTYRQNGLAVLEGIDDLRELAAAFPAVAGREPARTFVAGVSEGALVATLLAERSPELVSGVLATCGPIGDFRDQVDHVGDFRVLFDFFFPGVIPGSPIRIPQGVIDNWDSQYVPAIARAMVADLSATRSLVATTGVSFDPTDPVTIIQSAIELLWYNVFGTNDAVAKLGGNPYDNQARTYRGSADDVRLNANVQRFMADPGARAALAQYTPSGNLRGPLVALHTIGDPVVPFSHEISYLTRVGGGNRNAILIPIHRYGHCRFTPAEALFAFLVLIRWTFGP